MRNLGVALVLAVFMLAPHLAMAKKHAKRHARPRAMKTLHPHKQRPHAATREQIPQRDDDALAAAVKEQHETPRPTMTESAPSAVAQDNDDEVPGRKRH